MIKNRERKVREEIIEILKPLSDDSAKKVLAAVAIIFEIPVNMETKIHRVVTK